MGKSTHPGNRPQASNPEPPREAWGRAGRSPPEVIAELDGAARGQTWRIFPRMRTREIQGSANGSAQLGPSPAARWAQPPTEGPEMATSPMQPTTGMPPMDTKPMEPMAEEGQMPEDDGGYTICIKVDATGRISVGVERGSSEEGEYENFTPAKDRKDALTMALEILKADGDESALTGREQMSSAFSSGYGED